MEVKAVYWRWKSMEKGRYWTKAWPGELNGGLVAMHDRPQKYWGLDDRSDYSVIVSPEDIETREAE